MQRRLSNRTVICEIAAAWVMALTAAAAQAQDSSLLLHPAQSGPAQTMANGSFMYRELPPEARLRELKERDIITVIVDYRTILRSEGDAEQRKTQSLTAVLSSWIKFDGKSLQAAPQNGGDPRIAGTYNSQNRAESDVELRDSLTFRIGAQIMEIRPNGNLYIEGSTTIEANEEQWRVFVSGEVRREAIQPDRTVTSDAIYGLKVSKGEKGQVRDGYARGWASRWYDKYKPF